MPPLPDDRRGSSRHLGVDCSGITSGVQAGRCPTSDLSGDEKDEIVGIADRRHDRFAVLTLFGSFPFQSEPFPFPGEMLFEIDVAGNGERIPPRGCRQSLGDLRRPQPEFQVVLDIRGSHPDLPSHSVDTE